MNHLLKNVLLASLFFGPAFSLLAQERPLPSSAGRDAGLPKATDPTLWSVYKSIQIRLPALVKEDTRAPAPFSHFEVLDLRPDTARIGNHTEISPYIVATRNRQLALAGQAAPEIARYLNDHFPGTGTGFTALVVIRTFWVSDKEYTYNEVGDQGQVPGTPPRYWVIRLKAEIYAGKDNQYTPLKRFDSSVDMRLSTGNSEDFLTDSVLAAAGAYPQYSPYSRAGAGLASLLLEMVNSISQMDISARWVQGRRLSMGDINTFNQSRLDLPICMDDHLVRGVYRNFEEFKSNAPSIKDFEIQSDKKSSGVYLKDETGQSYLTHEVWGLCDGQSVYVMLGGVLYRAWKEQKAYYVSGDLNLSWIQKPDVVNFNGAGRVVKSKAKVYCVDMDTGNIY